MTAYRKKLIEVALPLKAINEASAREKSIRHGHPSTLHLWWARRPLAACRAVLFASLVDDPDSDPAYRKADGSVDEDAAGIKRADLFNLIEELVQWENSNNPEVIRSARAEIARCVASRKLEVGEFKADQELAPGITVKQFIRDCTCQPIYVGTEKQRKKDDKRRFRFNTAHLPPEEVVNNFLVEHAPPVLDPFAGGGSIPLEAQRLGLRAYASDLNPVAVLINKALIEIPPKFAGMPPVNPESRQSAKGRKKKDLLDTHQWKGAAGLAEDVRYYGQWMRDEAEKRIGHLYPKVKVTAEMAKERADLLDFVGKELTVVAWLWARTVQCPNPACAIEMPLAKSFWLSKKPGDRTWLMPVVRTKSEGIHFEVRFGDSPTIEGTVNRRGATCVACNSPVPLDYLRSEGKAGRMKCTMMGLVATADGKRVYLSHDASQDDAARVAKPNWMPDNEMAHNPFSLRPPLYGIRTFSELFTLRQLTALSTMCGLVSEARGEVERAAMSTSDICSEHGEHIAKSYADAVATYLALGVSRLSDICNSMCMWENTKTQVRHVFTRQAIPMLWDFAEPNVFGEAAGDFGVSLATLARVLQSLGNGPVGTTRQLDARAAASEDARVVSTDPPYYDNIDYADLSDFFYVWLRKCLASVYPELFSTVLVPKTQELVASPYRFDGDKNRAKDHFLYGLEVAFSARRAGSGVSTFHLLRVQAG
jgi:putative DNA methylase